MRCSRCGMSQRRRLPGISLRATRTPDAG
jgi:hypothetical protein